MLQKTDKENLKKDPVSGAIIIESKKTHDTIRIQSLEKRVEKLERIIYDLLKNNEIGSRLRVNS